MVCKDKNANYVIKLVDFDMSAKQNGLLKTKTIIGTKDYRAPELFQVNLDSDYKQLDLSYQGEPVDLFAIGVLIFNLVADFPGF